MEDLIIEAQPIVDAKVKAVEAQRDLCKSLCDEHKVNPPDVYRYKDMVYYYGNGWTETSITKPDPEEKFKDRVSPAFRKLYDDIRILRAFNKLDLLDVYLRDMANQGIYITIDDRDVDKSFDSTGTFETGIEAMCQLQKSICQHADTLRDIGPKAEEKNFCTKGRFKGLAEDYYKMTVKNKDISEHLHDSIAKNLLDNNGIRTILGEPQDVESSSVFIDKETGEVLDDN